MRGEARCHSAGQGDRFRVARDLLVNRIVIREIRAAVLGRIRRQAVLKALVSRRNCAKPELTRAKRIEDKYTRKRGVKQLQRQSLQHGVSTFHHILRHRFTTSPITYLKDYRTSTQDDDPRQA